MLFTEMICDGVCGKHIIVSVCVIGLVHSCVECRILLSEENVLQPSLSMYGIPA